MTDVARKYAKAAKDAAKYNNGRVSNWREVGSAVALAVLTHFLAEGYKTNRRPEASGGTDPALDAAIQAKMNRGQ